MKINLIRIANSIDGKNSYLNDSEQFLEDLNNELFDYNIELKENVKNSVLSIVFIETGGSEKQFLEIYETLKEPIMLLSNCKNNSLAACFEIKTFLNKNKISNHLLIGNDSEIAETIEKLATDFTTKKKISSSRLGVIGRPSDWLISSTCDYEKVEKRFGIKMIDITIEEINELLKDDSIIVDEELLNKVKMHSESEKDLETSLKFYYVLKEIVKKYDLNGFTIRCFDLIEKYNNTACLALSLLNDEGIVATCEGDVLSLLSMYLIKVILGQPSFQANPSQINFKDNSVIFSHCTIPTKMCSSYSLQTHFESDTGTAIKGEVRTGEAIIFKLKPNLKEYLFLKTEIVENTSNDRFCRTQVKVRLNNEELYSLLEVPFGNHVVIVFGSKHEEIFKVLSLFRVFPDM